MMFYTSSSAAPNNDTTYSSSTLKLKSNTIPDSVFTMLNLRHLWITGMDCDIGGSTNCWEIEAIPPQISRLKNLQTITLNVNAIATIPNELIQLKKLTSIDLSDNLALSNIDAITKIKSLRFLYLYGCGLNKLPANIGELNSLVELGLTGNNIDQKEQLRIKKALPNCIIRF